MCSSDLNITTNLKVGAFSPGMLTTQLITKVFEKGGTFSVDAQQMSYSPYNSYIGLYSPQRNEKPLFTNTSNIFKTISVNSKGEILNNNEIEISIYKLEWYWWWNSDYTKIANYISSSYNKPIKKINLKSTSDGLSQFTLNFPDSQWGTYYIEATDIKSGHKSGLMAYFDNKNENVVDLVNALRPQVPALKRAPPP